MTDSMKSALDKYIEFISKQDGVLQIYLFGSCANGTTHERSDIDLMVIVDDVKNTGKMAVQFYKGLAHTDVPLDILVNRKTTFYKAAENLTIQNTIKNTGVLLYG
jgi:predicted nucleotidyltransferase